jgi:foldase protein PrsA
VSLPDGLVAKVGKTRITEAQFNSHMTAILADTNQNGKPLVYQPPNFDACVGLRQAANQLDADAARDLCRKIYEQLRIAAMQATLQEEWTKQEAARRTIQPAPAVLRAALQQEKQAQFKTEHGYRVYLRNTTRSNASYVVASRIRFLSQAIARQVGRTVPHAGPDAVSAYYAKHRKQFALPARRDLRIVLTRKESEARQAMKALENGAEWSQVARQYSIDPQTKNIGGAVTGYFRSAHESDLDKAAFEAPPHKLVGPFKGQFGWFLIEVEKVLPADPGSLAKARPQIQAALTRDRQARAVSRFTAAWAARFKARSVCDDDFKTAACSNGPAVNPPPPPEITGTPSPQQQAPQ